MVESEQMQHRGVKVVEVNLVLHRIIAVFVCGAVADSRFDATSSQEHCQGVGVVVSAVIALCDRGAAEFSAPEHQCVFQKTTLLEVTDQAMNRLVDFQGILRERFFQSTVLVPLVAVGDLDEADAAFGESSCHQALAAKVLGGVVVEPVEFVDRLGFIADVLQLRCFALHAESQFKGCDSAFEVRVGSGLLESLPVDAVQQIQFHAL